MIHLSSLITHHTHIVHELQSSSQSEEYYIWYIVIVPNYVYTSERVYYKHYNSIRTQNNYYYEDVSAIISISCLLHVRIYNALCIFCRSLLST